MTMSLKGSLCWPLVLCSLVPWGGGGEGGSLLQHLPSTPGIWSRGSIGPLNLWNAAPNALPKTFIRSKKNEAGHFGSHSAMCGARQPPFPDRNTTWPTERRREGPPCRWRDP